MGYYFARTIIYTQLWLFPLPAINIYKANTKTEKKTAEIEISR